VHLETLRELRLAAPPQPGRPAHLSAASGLVRAKSMLYVVADDELQLGVFPMQSDDPGRLIRMIDGELPLSRAARKELKPDFEALTRLDPFDRYRHGALLAFGSGGRKHRRRVVLLALDEGGEIAGPSRVIDAARMFEGLSSEVDELNIEGAIVSGDRLMLMHRGNRSHPSNALIGLDLRVVLKSIVHEGSLASYPLVSMRRYDLGTVQGIPLSFTDGASLPDGGLLFSAVAEDTANNYSDGPSVAAAIGMIGTDGEVQALNYIDRACKIEGIYAERDVAGVRLWLVTDADDVDVPAKLLTGVLHRPCRGHDRAG
jgi:hypothetical protein